MPTTISAVCALQVLKAANNIGVDPAQLHRIPIKTNNPLEERIPYEDLLLLWEDVMRTARAPGFPIRVGSSAEVNDFDAVGFACMTQPTLREAIRQCVRYARAWTDHTTWAVEVKDHTVSMLFDCPNPFRLGVRCATEEVLAEMTNAGRLLTGVAYPVVLVRFRHEKPADTRVHEQFFQGEIQWNAPRNELVISSEIANLPLTKADSAMASFFERHVERLLEQSGTRTDGAATKLKAFLLREVQSGLPTLQTAAARLGMSPRTLKRRLQEEGTTFQDLLDEVRCDLAKRYLEAQKVSVGEVSFLLGFSEPSAFHRAFKRWTGTTPLSYQRAPDGARASL